MKGRAHYRGDAQKDHGHSFMQKLTILGVVTGLILVAGVSLAQISAARH
jgi:hypothetical protein